MKIFAFCNAAADFVAEHLGDKSLLKFEQKARHLNFSLTKVEITFKNFGKDLIKLANVCN